MSRQNNIYVYELKYGLNSFTSLVSTSYLFCNINFGISCGLVISESYLLITSSTLKSWFSLLTTKRTRLRMYCFIYWFKVKTLFLLYLWGIHFIQMIHSGVLSLIIRNTFNTLWLRHSFVKFLKKIDTLNKNVVWEHRRVI